MLRCCLMKTWYEKWLANGWFFTHKEISKIHVGELSSKIGRYFSHIWLEKRLFCQRDGSYESIQRICSYWHLSIVSKVSFFCLFWAARSQSNWKQSLLTNCLLIFQQSWNESGECISWRWIACLNCQLVLAVMDTASLTFPKLTYTFHPPPSTSHRIPCKLVCGSTFFHLGMASSEAILGPGNLVCRSSLVNILQHNNSQKTMECKLKLYRWCFDPSESDYTSQNRTT